MAFPSVPPMGPPPDAFSQGFTAPPPQTGGMFGGGKFGVGQAIVAALNGYLASTRGPAQQVGLNGLQMMSDQRKMALEEQVYEHRQNLEMQRQMAMLPIEARLKLMYPDNAFAQGEYQAGVMPGTPQWLKDMQTHQQNELDPAVVTPQGMMLRSQITGAMNAKPLSDADIAQLDAAPPQGGQTPPASGGFLGAPYPDAGPYHRY